MPHYPEEIDYSDKYSDDYYEYRHVMLPKEIYKKLPKGKLLTEAVSVFLCKRNGVVSESSSPEAGFITKFTSPNPIYCCSDAQKAQIPRLVSRLLASYRRPIPIIDLMPVLN
jgi:hypothetical protein